MDKRQQEQEEAVSEHIRRIQSLSHALKQLGDKDLEAVRRKRREIEELKRLIAEAGENGA